ncbi:MAG: single-stranded DNA-binding protein [Candidatus Fermentibacteraceae bacterium]|nr:single-stranded DNA-binding protein [Candidatus Fermentibacteraceae bacterium]
MDIRMPSINKVFLSGNLTADPRTNILENGTHVANFSMASNQSYKGKDGEWHDKTCFVDVVTWRQLAERVGSRLHKGSPVMIEGELQFTQWSAQDGSKRSRVEILARSVQMLEKTGGFSAGPSQGSGSNEPPRREEPQGSDYADDIPF